MSELKSYNFAASSPFIPPTFTLVHQPKETTWNPWMHHENNVTTLCISFIIWKMKISSVWLLSHAWLFATPWTTESQASLSITNSWSSPKSMSIESVMPSNHLVLCGPLLLLPTIFSSIRVFSNESTLHMRWPEYWSFSLSIIPSNEHPGLSSSRMDWLDLLAIQGTRKSLLQNHSSKSPIL